MPYSLRMGLRGWLARRKLRRVKGEWPILPGSERAPEGWQGWPEGKQFALVLTHDVESRAGLDKCEQLMALEKSVGFRSSFTLIPRGEYEVTREIREKMTGEGFEVAVHDCFHDGKLFLSEDEFRRNAPEINRHLRDWGAVGFRSGFMLHNLEWLHELEIEYDLSTFDTDPFEPQPEGKGTIFPFWVPRPADGGRLPVDSGRWPGDDGYAELPYTMPQDSTLFLLLRQKGIETWCRKLDWIASRGGMALLNVHPDYIGFDGDQPSSRTFPVAFYTDFLRYVNDRYSGACWRALPRDVAGVVRKTRKANSGNGAATRQKLRSAFSRPKIWIDLDNTPHVPFFEPIVEELKARGYPLLITARDAFQVCELAEKKIPGYIKVGKHYGKNRLMKGAGLSYRALQLAPLVLRERPLLCLSHGARSQLLVGTMLGIPRLLLEDYEYCEFPPAMRPTWLMTPEAIPDAGLSVEISRIRKYPGLKEDVYAWKLTPDAQILRDMGIAEGELVATVRPPATEAHYHNPESEKLFESFMNRICREAGARVVLLPRNRRQAEVIRGQWPAWFEQGRTIIPKVAVDGLNLIWHSDLVVSGGGTMNREAAALGVPVYSIFRGRIGAVDKQLAREGRLTLIISPEEAEKIPLVKRVRKPIGEVTSRRTLLCILSTIEQITDSLRNGREAPRAN
jgi:predicted glycosyltransferase